MRHTIPNVLLWASLTSVVATMQTPEVQSTRTTHTHFDHFQTGDPADVTATVRGGLLLAGGGTDQPDAFRWFFAQAGGGDIVVLRASGADGYHPFAMRIGGLNSIESFVVKSKEAASDPFLLKQLANAEGIFFAGGDQSRYVTFFKDSPVEDTINAAAARGVPVGGTSAGLAVLGEFSYSAMKDSTTTAEATANPYHDNVTLDRGFLVMPHMRGIITDSHVIERSRLGRTVAFMARLSQDGWLGTRPARAIAIDRATAILVDRDGNSHVVGDNTAHFMDASSPQMCAPGRPLTAGPVRVYTATRGNTFNLTTWTGTGGTMQTMRVDNGVVTGPTSATAPALTIATARPRF